MQSVQQILCESVLFHALTCSGSFTTTSSVKLAKASSFAPGKVKPLAGAFVVHLWPHKGVPADEQPHQ